MIFRIKSKELSLNREITAQLNENLANVLQTAGIPLAFTCNNNCECGTCVIRFSTRKDFMEFLILQPLNTDEAIVLRENGNRNLYFLCFLH